MFQIYVKIVRFLWFWIWTCCTLNKNNAWQRYRHMTNCDAHFILTQKNLFWIVFWKGLCFKQKFYNWFIHFALVWNIFLDNVFLNIRLCFEQTWHRESYVASSMVLSWFCLGSNEKALVLYWFYFRSNEKQLVLYRFCLGSNKKALVLYWFCLGTNEKALVL